MKTLKIARLSHKYLVKNYKDKTLDPSKVVNRIVEIVRNQQGTNLKCLSNLRELGHQAPNSIKISLVS